MGQSALARLGTGISVAFRGVTFEIYKADPPGIAREFADVTHMLSTGVREFIAHDLLTVGQAALDVAFDPALDMEAVAVSGSAYMTMYFPARTAANGTAQSAKNWSFSASVADYKPTGPLEEKMTANLTVKALGAVVIT